MVTNRQNQARKSLLVQVCSEKSFNELQSYCSQFGDIASAHHYSVVEDDSHFILLEFSKVEEADAALKGAVFNQDSRGIPAVSQFLWFRTGAKTKLKTEPQRYLNTVNGQVQASDDQLNEWLQAAETLEQQVMLVYNATTLDDLGTRLRYLAAQQLQNAISGMFPTAYAHPFGSSVNGFGKQGCDLDLILRLQSEEVDQRDSRLIFHTKANLNNGRTQAQRYMECLSDVLQLFLPGINNVRRILQARVPIVKYNHEYLDLEVDLSMNNLTGVYMSEILYMFGQLDSRVQPLTFCIRRWAKCVGLTNPTPGRWLSNFSLTLLVLFFLQTIKQPILPSINYFIQKARKEDRRVTEDNINCTFLRDLNMIDFTTKNTDTVETLLLQFFEFYSSFDFINRGLSLNDARTILKPDHSAVYILNPLEQAMNVSKNVSLEEVERFRIEVRNAAWLLESEHSNKSSDDPWGLLNLFKSNQQSLIRPHMFFKPRLVEVTDLFSGTEDENEIKIERIDYKNLSLKKQVEDITNATKKELNKIEKSVTSKPNVKSARRR